MKILIAEHAGFCFGVKRAMNMAWDKLIEKKENNKIYSLGPLIHNKQAVAKYEEKGLMVVDDIDDIQVSEYTNFDMIIRSHGVSKEVYDESKKRGIKIIDTTCPFVRKIHYIVNTSYNNGNIIIVLGDKNHPEVIGINGWCENNAIILKEIKEVKKLSFDKDVKYTIVAQTTMNEKIFDEIIEYVHSLKLNINVENTICSATKIRQNAARKLSKEVDFMVVIGGKHSSNTQKLVDICREEVATYAIETVEDLKKIEIDTDKIVGITAGASTPDCIIKSILEYLEKL